MSDRTSELRKKLDEKIASFAVGDRIAFEEYDDSQCDDNNDEAVEIQMVGTIIRIDGFRAIVSHYCGVSCVNLSGCKHECMG